MAPYNRKNRFHVLTKLTQYSRLKRVRAAVNTMFQRVQAQSASQPPIAESSHAPQQILDDLDEDFQGAPAWADVPFEHLPFMSKKQRMELSRKFPNLPVYIFLSDNEKNKYFRDLSDDFNKKMSQLPQKVSKTKKIVKFGNNFQVRPFKKSQIATKVSSTKSFQDKYGAYHFS